MNNKDESFSNRTLQLMEKIWIVDQSMLNFLKLFEITFRAFVLAQIKCFENFNIISLVDFALILDLQKDNNDDSNETGLDIFSSLRPLLSLNP